MPTYIIINHTRNEVETALFSDDTCIDYHHHDKQYTSKNLIVMLDALCLKNNITLADVAFIGINQGPGAFSTLRSIIATINGIHYATGIPLVGVDALQATAQEFYNPAFEYSLTLFNAYNQELYYAITHHTTVCATGYGTLPEIITLVAKKVGSHTVYCIGDGTILYKNELQQNGDVSFSIPDPTPQLCSLAMIAHCALEQYRTHKNDSHSYLFPLHLKKHAVER